MKIGGIMAASSLKMIALVACAALVLAFRADPLRAASMSDLWYNPAEPGWGVNLIEQQGTLFVTLFVYGQDGRPTWLVGSDVRQIASSTGRNFSGALYENKRPMVGNIFQF
jgi:hypothetical protein